MLKKLLRTFSLLLIPGAVLTTSVGAFANPEIKGTVYQITPTDVYVEMADHTAVRVPDDKATFLMDGAPMDVTALRRGNYVTVQWAPRTSVTTTTMQIDSIPPVTRERTTVTHDTMEHGQVVHHVFYDGAWHEQP